MTEKAINENTPNPEQSSENTSNTEANSSQENQNKNQSVKLTSNEFKDVPIQLVLSSSNGLLETTTEAINILTGLKNEKLCILSLNGPLSTGKSYLANNIINKKNVGFKVGEKTEGIWLWGNPIQLNNGSKLLILDCEGLNKNDKEKEKEKELVSFKLFKLCVLLSTCIIYNTQGELNDDFINDFVHFTDLSKEIKVHKDEENETNNINDLKNFFPELILVNDILSKENMKELIENNSLCQNSCKLFNKKSYINGKNLEELINKVKNEINYKEIKNNIMDGDSLFCLLQNYIDLINNNKIPVIDLALENVLLSKAKNESEFIFEEFKNAINKKIEYPMPITDIYKIYLELQQNFTNIFCNRVDKILTPSQTGKYVQKIFTNMGIELESILETNKEHYDEKYCIVYKEFETELNKLNLNSMEEIKVFIISYTSSFQNCLNKLLNIRINDFNKNLINILSKIINDFMCEKLTKMADTINNMYENNSKEYKNNIENLNINIKNITEQIDNGKKLLENKNKENSEINKNFLESEAKVDKLNKELKIKEIEYEKNMDAEVKRYEKLEAYYNNQIKEKEQIITNLENKIEKLKQDILGANQESSNKMNELSRENIKLQREIENLKNEEGKENPEENNEQNLNTQTLFKNIQNAFIGFKESIDKLEKQNENIFKSKSNSLEEIGSKLKNRFSEIKDVKEFCDSQIKAVNDNYKKEINQVTAQYKELSFEMTKIKFELNEQTQLKDNYESKLNESLIQINQLKENCKAKENSIKIQNDLIKMYEDKIENNKKKINDLEISLCKNIYSYKMAEDDFETLLMVIQGLITKNKEKFGRNILKIPLKDRTFINSLVKEYNFISHD